MTKTIKTPYKKGDRFKTRIIDLRIIAIAENYVMLRYLGCKPFIKHVSEMREFLAFVKAELIKK